MKPLTSDEINICASFILVQGRELNLSFKLHLVMSACKADIVVAADILPFVPQNAKKCLFLMKNVNRLFQFKPGDSRRCSVGSSRQRETHHQRSLSRA